MQDNQQVPQIPAGLDSIQAALLSGAAPMGNMPASVQPNLQAQPSGNPTSVLNQLSPEMLQLIMQALAKDGRLGNPIGGQVVDG